VFGFGPKGGEGKLEKNVKGKKFEETFAARVFKRKKLPALIRGKKDRNVDGKKTEQSERRIVRFDEKTFLLFFGDE